MSVGQYHWKMGAVDIRRGRDLCEAIDFDEYRKFGEMIGLIGVPKRRP